MTLDDLIEALQELKRYCPASGTAVVVGVGEPTYGGGRVHLVDGWDDDEEDDDEEDDDE